MTVFESSQNHGLNAFHIFPKGVKMTQNRSKPWAIAHAFCSKMAKNDCF